MEPALPWQPFWPWWQVRQLGVQGQRAGGKRSDTNRTKILAFSGRVCKKNKKEFENTLQIAWYRWKFSGFYKSPSFAANRHRILSKSPRFGGLKMPKKIKQSHIFGGCSSLLPQTCKGCCPVAPLLNDLQCCITPGSDCRWLGSEPCP